MTRADGGRFCGDCKKVVRDLSSMSEPEARALLGSAPPGELCVRFLYGAHGRVLFADRPADERLIPAALLSRTRRLVAVAAMPFAVQACALLGQTDEMMGLPDPHMSGDAGATSNAFDEGSPDDAGDAAAPVDAASDARDASDAHADGGTDSGETRLPFPFR
jgi:hypothetical protein